MHAKIHDKGERVMVDQVQPTKEESVLQGLTKEDGKLFLITVAATVVANIVTVIIVAIAIILARSARPHPATPANYAFSFVFALVPALVGLPTLYSLSRFKGSSQLSDNVNKVIKLIIRVLVIVVGTLSLLFILAWIGFAAGIS
jgi:amino acid transporter